MVRTIYFGFKINLVNKDHWPEISIPIQTKYSFIHAPVKQKNNSVTEMRVCLH